MRPLLFALCLLCLPSLPVHAQGSGGYAQNANQKDPTLILKEEMSTIRDSSSQLQGRIRTAMEKLEEVARITTEDQKAQQVDQLFITLRTEITTVLDQLDSNSPYADALNRAKEGTIVLKSWYVRQPDDYPSRDANIQQLEQAIKEYDVLDARLEESRNLAQDKLTTVVRQHRIIVQQMKIGKVLEALDSARAVVESLNDITRAIAVVEERTNESLNVTAPIAN